MKYGDEKRDNLEKLERKLYSKSTPSIMDVSRSKIDLPDEEEEINKTWQNAENSTFDELAAKMSRMKVKGNNIINKIFVFSVLFFVVACGVAAFVFFGGMNAVSSKNVDIKVVGPLTSPGGQEASFDINIINNNSVDLESASLLVEYPDGTRSALDMTKELSQERFSLEKIKPGESFSQNIKAIFFGEKNSVKKIKISLEYRVKNSSALFYKEKIHDISISSTPIIVTSTYPKEINSNQEISFNVEIVSNSKDKVENFLANIEYPFGFVFKESFPKPSFGNNIWQFSSLASGEKKNILIKGSIIGQDNEEKIFKVSVGSQDKNDERIIAVPFLQSLESVLVKKPFIGLDVFIDGKSGDFVAQNNRQINTEFVVRNNLPSKLFNVSVVVSLGGGAFDQANVSANNGGFFQSFNNTILWDKRSVPDFAYMDPGLSKDLSFSVIPLSYSNIAKGVKPEIDLNIKVEGERVLESGSVEKVYSSETRKIILTSNVNFSSRVVRSIGNLENSGPIPPKADTPTTYTVVWSISNSFNQISNVEIKATLPPYVKWTNLKYPNDEILSFNQVTNEIIWNVGSVLPNAGFDSPKKEIYFQLEFLPSLSQVGQSPILLGEAYLSGNDKITGAKIESRASAVTTNFYGDPIFKTGDDKVVK